MRRIATILALTVCAGCTRNAILELELELPPVADPVRFAVVDVRSDEPFDPPWAGEGAQSFPLTACSRHVPAPACAERTLDSGCSRVISVVTGGGSLEAPLHVRVRFCRDRRCAALEDASAPEHRVVIERAFYVGHYTQARVCVDQVPAATSPDPELIERCDVRCREGAAAMYCRLDGSHFCEE